MKMSRSTNAIFVMECRHMPFKTAFLDPNICYLIYYKPSWYVSILHFNEALSATFSPVFCSLSCFFLMDHFKTRTNDIKFQRSKKQFDAYKFPIRQRLEIQPHRHRQHFAPFYSMNSFLTHRILFETVSQLKCCVCVYFLRTGCVTNFNNRRTWTRWCLNFRNENTGTHWVRLCIQTETCFDYDALARNVLICAANCFLLLKVFRMDYRILCTSGHYHTESNSHIYRHIRANLA